MFYKLSYSWPAQNIHNAQCEVEKEPNAQCRCRCRVQNVSYNDFFQCDVVKQKYAKCKICKTNVYAYKTPTAHTSAGNLFQFFRRASAEYGVAVSD